MKRRRLDDRGDCSPAKNVTGVSGVAHTDDDQDIEALCVESVSVMGPYIDFILRLPVQYRDIILRSFTTRLGNLTVTKTFLPPVPIHRGDIPHVVQRLEFSSFTNDDEVRDAAQP